MKTDKIKSKEKSLEKVHPIHKKWVEELLQKGASEKEVMERLEELEKEM